MTVIAFEPRPLTWRKSELDAILEAFAPVFSHRAASGWDVSHTEHGDPQFYLLGPKPDQECILCISRVGQTYILNDGEGRHMIDLSDLEALSVHVQALLTQGAARILAKMVVIWCGVKQAFHDKLEPLVAEGEELLVHFVPQIAALA